MFVVAVVITFIGVLFFVVYLLLVFAGRVSEAERQGQTGPQKAADAVARSTIFLSDLAKGKTTKGNQ